MKDALWTKRKQRGEHKYTQIVTIGLHIPSVKMYRRGGKRIENHHFPDPYFLHATKRIQTLHKHKKIPIYTIQQQTYTTRT